MDNLHIDLSIPFDHQLPGAYSTVDGSLKCRCSSRARRQLGDPGQEKKHGFGVFEVEFDFRGSIGRIKRCGNSSSMIGEDCPLELTWLKAAWR